MYMRKDCDDEKNWSRDFLGFTRSELSWMCVCTYAYALLVSEQVDGTQECIREYEHFYLQKYAPSDGFQNSKWQLSLQLHKNFD
jgi:hypothetical protein